MTWWLIFTIKPKGNSTCTILPIKRKRLKILLVLWYHLKSQREKRKILILLIYIGIDHYFPCFLKMENPLVLLKLCQTLRLGYVHNKDFSQIFIKLLIPYTNMLHRSNYWKYVMYLHTNFKFKDQYSLDELLENPWGNLSVCINRVTLCENTVQIVIPLHI